MSERDSEVDGVEESATAEVEYINTIPDKVMESGVSQARINKQRENEPSTSFQSEQFLHYQQQQQEVIDRLFKLLESQKNNVNQPIASDLLVSKLPDFKLTRYDPDDSPYSMKEWLDIACSYKDRYLINDEDMIMKVGESLMNRALKYYCHWKPKSRTWQNLVSALTSSFPVIGTPFTRLCALRNTRSSDCDNLTTFCHKKLQEINAMHELDFPWHVVLSIVEGCVEDSEVRTAIRMTKPSNESELITLMSERDNDLRLRHEESQVRGKRQHQHRYESNKHKQTTNTASAFLGKCFNCNKAGHKAHDCLLKQKAENTVPTRDEMPSKRARIICTNCKKLGHTEEQCFFKIGLPEKGRTSNVHEKAVNKVRMIKGKRFYNRIPVCTAANDYQTIFTYILDTGSEISLVHEHVAIKLGATITNNETVLQGIGVGTTVTKGTCIINVIMTNITIEIEFAVVTDGTIPDADALIGWDVISRPGLKLEKVENQLELQHDITTSILICRQENRMMLDQLSGLDELLVQKIIHLPMLTKKITPSAVPVAYRLRPLAYAEHIQLKQIIEEQIGQGIIRESSSEYASPVVLVKKKNGSLRLCIDFRDLNKRVVRDRYPLPRIQDQIDALNAAKFYCTLDMKSGFHQMLVEKESRHLRAFVTSDSHYEYDRMPFGFCELTSLL